MRKTTFIKSLFLAVALLVGNAAWAETVDYTGDFTNSTGASGSYTADQVITLNSETWLASNSYFGSGEFRLGHNKETGLVPSEFLATTPQGASIEMQWDIANVSTVSVICTKTYGTADNWYIFESTDQGANWTQVATGTTAISTWTYSTSSPLSSARYAFVIEGSKARAVLTTVSISTETGTPSATKPTIGATGIQKATDTYFNTAEITLSTSTDGAAIYYTTDGTEPTDASTSYTAAFSITETKTIKAIAVKDGLDNSAVSEKTITIVAPASATTPYSESFNNTLGDWVTFEVAGSKPWVASTNGASVNGYSGGDVESWLISPKFTAKDGGLALAFNYASKYVGNPLAVKMSADYVGYGAPSVATWTEISSIQAPVAMDNDYTVKASGDIVAPTTGTVYFALVYDVSAAPYSDWNITNATVSNYSMPTTPTITVTELTVPAMEAVAGMVDSQTIHVTGLALVADIEVSIDGANAAMFSVSPTTIAQTAGEASGTVTVTYSPTDPGTHTAILRLNSTDAIEQTLDLIGTSTLAIPVATAATGVSITGFTANWDAVVGATDYELSVYTKEEGAGSPSTIFSEDFSGFTKGTPDAGANSTDISDNLDTYTQTAGWTGVKVYEAGESAKMGTSSVLGTITTPAIDLSAAGLTLSFKAMAWSGDATDMKVFLDNELLYTATDLGNTPDYVFGNFSTPITGGTASSTLRFEGSKASKGRFFIDDVVISTGGASSTPISGSPFTVTGTSQAITGLSAGTTYHYIVIAKNGTIVSAASNEVAVTTGPATGLSAATQALNMRAVNGHILFNSEAGQVVEVYNSLGQKLVQSISIDGLNSIPVNVKGIVLVKINNEVTKLLAK